MIAISGASLIVMSHTALDLWIARRENSVDNRDRRITMKALAIAVTTLLLAAGTAEATTPKQTIRSLRAQVAQLHKITASQKRQILTASVTITKLKFERDDAIAKLQTATTPPPASPLDLSATIGAMSLFDVFHTALPAIRARVEQHPDTNASVYTSDLYLSFTMACYRCGP